MRELRTERAKIVNGRVVLAVHEDNVDAVRDGSLRIERNQIHRFQLIPPLSRQTVAEHTRVESFHLQ
jgi:hypothetical protein